MFYKLVHERFLGPHRENVMGQAPLNRDEQIAFIKNGSARRAAAIERWSNSETYRAVLNESAKPKTSEYQYVSKDFDGRRFA
jgi:hypothetical protein